MGTKIEWATDTFNPITGAETGPRKRLMKTEWALDLQKQCEIAGVPFFFKKDSFGLRKLNGNLYEEIPI